MKYPSCLMILLGTIVPCSTAQTVEFIPLGDLHGGANFSIAYSVSENGSVVVGTSSSIFHYWGEPMRWTPDEGMSGLGVLNENDIGNAAAVSPDGNWVVGDSGRHGVGQAFRWSEAGGMENLGDLPGGKQRAYAYGVSNNGQVVIGKSSSARSGQYGNEAFRWTPDEGMVGMGFLPGSGNLSSYARGISADGTVIVGGSSSDEATNAFRWTERTGMVALTPAEEGLAAGARGLSDNGKWTVGSAKITSTYDTGYQYIDEAVIWGPDGTPRLLGQLVDLGPISTLAFDSSDDGRVVVGTAQTRQGTKAFVWTPDWGMRSLEDVLLDYGFDAAAEGWRLDGLSAITPDGTTLVGWGLNTAGGWHNEAFLIHLPIPTPSTLASTSIAALGLLAARRRR